MDYTITRRAEFGDKKLEAEFFAEDVKKGLNVIRYAMVIFCFIHFLFFFLDILYLVPDDITEAMVYSLIPRVILLLISIILFFASKRIKSSFLKMNLMSFFIIFAYAVHIWMALHFVGRLDITSEAFDVMICIFSLFLVNNRWINNLIACVLLSAMFVSAVPHLIPGINAMYTVGLGFYSAWVAIIVGIILHHINRIKRSQYIKEKQLEFLAETDPLTKAYNRLVCDSLIAQMCHEERCFSVIVFDVDNFKTVNDSFGHLAGDAVLKGMAGVVKENIRAEDILVRWGGDEFLILLLDTPLAQACELAQRIRTVIEEKRCEGLNRAVTASFGVTEYEKGDDARSIINRVDQQLYCAKMKGKNAIISA